MHSFFLLEKEIKKIHHKNNLHKYCFCTPISEMRFEVVDRLISGGTFEYDPRKEFKLGVTRNCLVNVPSNWGLYKNELKVGFT